MGEPEEFNTLVFEKKLMQLKDTQESIQSLSSWCLKQREHHKKIVSSWLNVLKRVKIDQRLVLFYLANDVIQYSKRKNYEFVESWGLNLQKATPLVRDEKVRPRILRIFKIWEQRNVYDDEFLSDLTGLLSVGATKKTDDDPLDFQPQQLVNKIKQCSVLEADTDMKLKNIHENKLDFSDPDALCNDLKERSLKDDVMKEINEGIQCVEQYTQSLQREIVAREALLALMNTANQYYSTQKGEVKVVAYAYKNFGSRVKALKRKLDSLIPTLPSAVPSPPQRDEDVPSPGPDEDLELPQNEVNEDDVTYNIDRTFNTSTMSADGSLYNLGLSSFLGSDNAMSMSFFNDDTSTKNVPANKIEVINNRPNDKQDFNINDFLKNLVNENSPASDNNSGGSAAVSQKSDGLPGLDLLTEMTNNPPPPTSFYGSMDATEEPEPYRPENPRWTNSSWTVPAPVPPVSIPTIPVSQIPPIPSIPTLPSRPTLPTIPTLPSLPTIPTIPTLPSMPTLPTIPMPVPAPGPGPGLGPGLGTGPVFKSPPASPPHQNTMSYPPPPAKIELQPVDVDHRGILPPPPPPPVLPLLGNLEDVDHRLLSIPPPLPVPAPRNMAPAQDVDHRNLISLTHMPPVKMDPRMPMMPPKLDQDYRVPPLQVAPSDIVESVDMDLSEDEEQHGMFQNQNPNEHRRHSFNNNKVLVGGDNGKTNHVEPNTNLRPIGRAEIKEPQSAPIIPPLTNPFENMPQSMQNFTRQFREFPQKNTHAYQQNLQDDEKDSEDIDSSFEEDIKQRNLNSDPRFDEDIRQRNLNVDPRNFDEDIRQRFNVDPRSFEDDGRQRNMNLDPRNQSPEFKNFNSDFAQRPFQNQRFPRPMGPRTNFRPPFDPNFGPQFFPRNGPRPPRWMGPRPQRFW